MPAVNFEKMARRQAMLEPHGVETNGLMWMAVHGALALALRHPLYRGPSRNLLLSFYDELGERLITWGVLTSEELAAARQVEQEESPHK